MIKYMTPEERRTPKLLFLDPTAQARCRRIAKDAGVKLSVVSVSDDDVVAEGVCK